MVQHALDQLISNAHLAKTFPGRTQAQNESAPSIGCARLVGVPNDARIE